MITLKHNTDCRMRVREYPHGAFKSWQGCVKWRGHILWDERWLFDHVACRIEAHARFVACQLHFPALTRAYVDSLPADDSGLLSGLERVVSLAHTENVRRQLASTAPGRVWFTSSVEPKPALVTIVIDPRTRP